MYTVISDGRNQAIVVDYLPGDEYRYQVFGSETKAREYAGAISPEMSIDTARCKECGKLIFEPQGWGCDCPPDFLR